MNVRVCDFCHAPAPAWEYPAHSFAAALVALHPETRRPLNSAEWRSEGAWHACEACAALIEDGEIPDLTRRALAAHPEHNGLEPWAKEILADTLKRIHEAFADARTGERRAL